MKKKIIIGISLLVLVISIVGVVLFFKKDNEITLKEYIEEKNEIVLNDNAVPKYIGGKFSNVKVVSKETAYDALSEVKDLYKIKNVKSEFSVEETKLSDDVTYYEFQQKYNSIVVNGSKLTMSVDKDGNVLGINGNYTPDVNVVTSGLLKENEVKSKLNLVYGDDTDYLNIEKYIYVDVSKTYVVYDVYVSCSKGLLEVVVNAKDGSIVTEDELGSYANYTYTGKGLNDVEHTISIDEKTDLLSGDKSYEFYDAGRNIQIVDATYMGADLTGIAGAWIFSGVTPFTARMNDSGELQYGNIESLKNAVTTLSYFEDIYDYYNDVLGRDSYDNKGSKIIVNINVSSKSFTNQDLNNAAWVGLINQMFIGNFDGTSFSLNKDVLGHEFTHGVISTTSKFTNPTKENRNKPNETGSLNEAYSDIIGTLIEDKDWLISDSSQKAADAVGRDLENPSKYNKPSQVNGDYYFPNAYLDGKTLEEYLEYRGVESLYDLDRGGEHHNATIVGHAAYLMYDNGAFKNKKEMAKVWYNSLLLLSSHSDFEDCAYAVIQAASNLGLDREKISIIKDAFVETKMLSQEYYKLSGTVTDEDDNKLQEVLVTAINEKNSLIYFETYTNDKGEYEFTELPKDGYIISFEKAKYLGTEKNITLDEDTSDIDAKLELIDEKKYKDSEIVFVMDNSLSMDDSDPNDVRKQIIANILGSLNNNASVALVTFTKDAKVVNNGLKDSTVDKKIIITDIFNLANDNGTNDNSGTNGAAGIQKALKLFNSDSKARKYIVFLTDGEDNKQNVKSYDELIEDANDKDVRILTIGLGSDVNADTLMKIAKETNGKYYQADSSTKLYRFDKRIFDELN